MQGREIIMVIDFLTLVDILVKLLANRPMEL